MENIVTKNIEELPQDLIDKGGALVLSSECCLPELHVARMEGRFYTRKDGFGFVRRTQEWLASTKEAAKAARKEGE
jgi:hypothetical protein